VLHYAERSFDSWLANASAYGRNDVIFGRDLGQGWLLDSIGREFHDRHRLVQALTRASVRYSTPGRLATVALTMVARLVSSTGPKGASNVALSALYNLEYYRGMADELGDPHLLLAHFDDASGQR
jgi:hypothetical protein